MWVEGGWLVVYYNWLRKAGTVIIVAFFQNNKLCWTSSFIVSLNLDTVDVDP